MLVDHARGRKRLKRGGDADPVPALQRNAVDPAGLLAHRKIELRGEAGARRHQPPVRGHPVARLEHGDLETGLDGHGGNLEPDIAGADDREPLSGLELLPDRLDILE